MSKELLSKERVILVSLCAVSALLVSASVFIGWFFNAVYYPDLRLTSAILFAVILYYTATVRRIDRQRKKAEEELADRERGYRDLFDHGQGLICIHDVFGTITAANPAALLSLGYSKEEIIGQSLRELLHEEQRTGFDAYLRKVVHEGEADGLLSVLTKGGKTLFWRYHNVLVCEPDEEPYVLGHAQDVTQLIEAKNALKNLSLTDELTGLYNRRGFLTFAEQQVKLERHQSTARGLVLLFADLDGLKKINDTYGHEAGSEAIIAFSGILKSCLRASDLIARWGGDEFVILSIGSSDKNAGPILERINNGVSKYNAESDKPYKIACSIGFTKVEGGGWKSLECIIAEADTAMYAEKRIRKVKSGTAV
jgi:diguanylate cyclase (GGDEF)-like protein/PAS domain S-box-containing protein